MERTLMMIKPDAVERGLIGRILAMAEAADLKIAAMRLVQLTPEEARTFYKVHEGKPFLGDLVQFMSRSPVVAAVLEGEGAVQRWRDVCGATNPADAAPGTVRAAFGRDVGENSVHGSDSVQNAETEIRFFGLTLDLR